MRMPGPKMLMPPFTGPADPPFERVFAKRPPRRGSPMQEGCMQ